MGKVVSLLAACILLASAIPGLAPRVAVAQTLTLPCSVTAPSPMQGQYTGPWHSDGDYHFSAYNTDIELKITIDGTLSLTVSPDGHVSGTATGSVQAPIYDYGRLDVSSGYGTISGPVSGMLTASGPALTLSAPVILMHWGTFVGGGYTVDQNITMPDYTLSVGNSQCISASGSIAETDFPPKWLVADGTGQPPVLAPGRGTATGTWNVTSSDADLYNQLSQQVDGFISSANGVLAGNPSYATAQTQIIQPLQTLVATIEAHPTVARCLLERLGTWAVSASASLYGTASTTVSAIPAAVVGALPDVRSATDTIRLADTLGVSCHVSDGGVSDRLTAALTGALQGWAATGDAVNTADLAREFLLWKGAAGEPAAQTAINSGIHGQHPPADASSLLAALRNAYVFGDDADASILYERIAAAPHALSAQAKSSSGKKKKRKPKPKPTARPTPRPKPTARPAPTAAATPKTLEQVLTSGITTISGNASAGTVPTFSWQAVKTTSGSPVQYVVTVTGASGVVWTWAGTTTSATFGDTTQADLPGSAADGWTAPLPSGYHWSVLALAGDRVVGLKLR